MFLAGFLLAVVVLATSARGRHCAVVSLFVDLRYLRWQNYFRARGKQSQEPAKIVELHC